VSVPEIAKGCFFANLETPDQRKRQEFLKTRHPTFLNQGTILAPAPSASFNGRLLRIKVAFPFDTFGLSVCSILVWQFTAGGGKVTRFYLNECRQSLNVP
jgi:hypothetical protein